MNIPRLRLNHQQELILLELGYTSNYIATLSYLKAYVIIEEHLSTKSESEVQS